MEASNLYDDSPLQTDVNAELVEKRGEFAFRLKTYLKDSGQRDVLARLDVFANGQDNNGNGEIKAIGRDAKLETAMTENNCWTAFTSKRDKNEAGKAIQAGIFESFWRDFLSHFDLGPPGQVADED